MKITVFGASGGIGQRVVSLAADGGHAVRAVYRSTPDVPPHPAVEVLTIPDILDSAFAEEAVRGADVVITAVGPNFAQHHNPRSTMTSPPDLHRELARTLVAAMGGAGTLISVSTASMGPADAVMSLAPRLLFRFFRTVLVRNLGAVGKDLVAMEGELAASGLDWYAVRPVKLTDGPRTERVHAGDQFAMKTISRADVAWYVLTLAENPDQRTHRTPIITTAKHRPARTEPDRPPARSSTAAANGRSELRSSRPGNS